MIKNQKRSMPRETEKNQITHPMIGGKQTSGPNSGEKDQKELEGNLKAFSQDGHGVMSFFSCFFLVGVVPTGFAPTW